MAVYDRDWAIRAVALCDQAESHLLSGDEVFIDEYKTWFLDFAARAEVAELLVFIKSLRARALEIIAEEREGARGV